MTPPVARFAARVQVGIAVGTLPAAIGTGVLIAPFDWQTAFFVAIYIMVSAIFLSALFVPIAGLVVSWMGFGKGSKVERQIDHS